MNSRAVAILPVSSQSLDQSTRRWLSRGAVTRCEEPHSALARVLSVLGGAVESSGLAALRAWGDLGKEPDGWICGADPVFLEAQLDKLYLRALGNEELAPSELAACVSSIEDALGSQGSQQFCQFGTNSYLLSDEPILTADLPAEAVQGLVAPHYMPRGPAAAGHNRLVSEVQMVLYENPTNLARLAEGKEPVSSLWFWGGGTVPQLSKRSMPKLFSSDSLLRGYWHAVAAHVAAAPASSGELNDVLSENVVVDLRSLGDTGEQMIAVLRKVLARRVLDELVLLFADGLRVSLQHRDRLRFWRRESSLLKLS